jgi:hypothetical protein
MKLLFPDYVTNIDLCDYSNITMDVFQYLLSNTNIFHEMKDSRLLQVLDSIRDLDVFEALHTKFLHRILPLNPDRIISNKLIAAYGQGRNDIMEYLSSFLPQLCANGLDYLQYLPDPKKAIEWAFGLGLPTPASLYVTERTPDEILRVEFQKFATEHQITTINLREHVVERGILETVKWLHKKKEEPFVSSHLDLAAKNGHIDVVRFLHFEAKLRCNEVGFRWAIYNGHLQVVKFLFQHQKERLNGYLISRDRIYYTLKEGKPFQHACKKGDYHMVQWMIKNRQIDCDLNLTAKRRKRYLPRIVELIEGAGRTTSYG